MAGLGPLVGRRRELAELVEVLASARLVTLTGPGGIGKTTLAMEAGRMVEATMPVSAVRLAMLVDGEVAVSAIAAAVGAAGGAGRDGLRAAAEAVGAEARLLVVDNCEHVADAVGEAVEELLGWCPNLRVLATSRERLRVAGEQVWPVPPLSISGVDGAGGDAVELFVARARAVLPSFDPDAAGLDAVAEVCARLDGMALAIELAAARVDTLSVRELAAHLDDCFVLLDEGVGRRGRTMRAALDWSYGLLGEDERVVLRRLSVFASGCTLAGAEAVAGAAPVPPGAVLGILSRLIAKSVVVAERDAHGQGTRYRLLEPIRQHMHAKLRAAGEEHDCEQRHAEHLLALADQHLTDQQVVLFGWAAQAAVAVERANVLSLLRWAVESPRPDLGLAVAGATARIFQTTTTVSERQALLRRVSALMALDAASTVAPAVQSRALLAVVPVAWIDFDQALAESLAAAAVATARRSEDPAVLVHALVQDAQIPQGREPRRVLAKLPGLIAAAEAAGDADSVCVASLYAVRALVDVGDVAGARAALDRLRQRLGPAVTDLWLFQLGLLDSDQAYLAGDLALAEDVLVDPDPLCAPGHAVSYELRKARLERARGERAGFRARLERLGQVAADTGLFWAGLAEAEALLDLDEGQPDASAAKLAGSAVRCRQGQRWWALAGIERHRAEACLRAGRLREAEAALAVAADLAERYDNPWQLAPIDGLRAELCLQAGDPAAAMAHARAAMAQAVALDAALGVIDALEVIVLAAGGNGQRALAERVAAAVEARRSELGYRRPPATQPRWDHALAALDPGRESGADFQDVLDELLATPVPARRPSPPPPPPPLRTVARLQKTAAGWQVDHGAESAAVRDSKGMHALAVLLASPGVEHLAADLAGSPAHGDTGPILDRPARDAYRQRAQVLSDDLADARQRGDSHTMAAIRAELEAIADQLTHATGAHGRDRRPGSGSERARVNVTRTIRAAIKDLAVGAPQLAAVLDRDIRTGTYCSYRPNPATNTTWQVTT